MSTPTNTYGGGIDQRAVIGHAPESREWTPAHPHFPPRVDATARVEAFATIDAGTTDLTTVVSARAWIFKHAHVGHDALIGEDVEVGTHAVIGGHAIIRRGARIGIGAVVLPHRTVGADAVVGAGSVVVHNVPDGATVAGNPARIVDRNPVPYTKRCKCAPKKDSTDAVVVAVNAGRGERATLTARTSFDGRGVRY